MQANRRREARAAVQALERANKVHIMRQYRTGNFSYSMLPSILRVSSIVSYHIWSYSRLKCGLSILSCQQLLTNVSPPDVSRKLIELSLLKCSESLAVDPYGKACQEVFTSLVACFHHMNDSGIHNFIAGLVNT